jgi:GTP cyclohydrolase I
MCDGACRPELLPTASDSHAGMKWLAARRPEQYRKRKEEKHIQSMDDAFLKFLEQIDEEQKREKALNAPGRVIELKEENIIAELEAEWDDGAAQVAEG